MYFFIAVPDSSKKKRGSKSKRRSKESSATPSEPKMSSEVAGEANGVVNSPDRDGGGVETNGERGEGGRVGGGRVGARQG